MCLPLVEIVIDLAQEPLGFSTGEGPATCKDPHPRGRRKGFKWDKTHERKVSIVRLEGEWLGRSRRYCGVSNG
jgi:hypothetical protein